MTNEVDVRNKIIAALGQADIHYDESWGQAEDAPRELDPLDYLGDFQATAIGTTGEYFDDDGTGTWIFIVLLDGRFLVNFHLSLPQYCDDESDARLGMTVTDLGEDPESAKKAAYEAFNKEVTSFAIDAVLRVFQCSSVQNLDQKAELAFYKDLAKTMHAGIDEQIQKLKCFTPDQDQ